VVPRLSSMTRVKFSRNCFAVKNLSGEYALYYGPLEKL